MPFFDTFYFTTFDSFMKDKLTLKLGIAHTSEKTFCVINTWGLNN